MGELGLRLGEGGSSVRVGHDLSGSNATPLVSRYRGCRATLVSHFSPYAFAVSHENRATPLEVSQKRPCRTLLGGVSHLKLAMHISLNRVALQGVSQPQCRESRYTATLRTRSVVGGVVERAREWRGVLGGGACSHQSERLQTLH